MISSVLRRIGQRATQHMQACESSLQTLQRSHAPGVGPSAFLPATLSAFCRSSTSSPTLDHSHNTSVTPPLNFCQLMMARRILRRRKSEPESSQRHKNLKVFKKEAQTGMHDVEVPMWRWVDQIQEHNSAVESSATSSAVLRGSLFNRPVNRLLLYQVVRWQRARRRQPIASTKTKAEVRGGGRKPHAQKGSGRARQGSIRSPHMRGGGVVFGPKPRSFAFQLPKKVRRAGLMAAMSSKTQQSCLFLVDSFTLSQEQAQHCLWQRIFEMAGSIKDIDTYFVPQKLQRERLYNAIMGDESILQDADGNLLDDHTVADNVLQRTLENKEPLIPLFMNTGVFKESLFKLLPPAVRDERLVAAENIITSLNAFIPTDSSIDHSITENPKMLKMFQIPVDRKNRRDTVLVIHSNSGEDCGAIEKSSGKKKGEPVPVDFIKLEATMLRRFTANLKNVNCLPARGANVMDILRHRYLIITEAGLRDLTERLTRPLNRGFKPAGYDWQKMKQESADRVAREKERRKGLDDWIRSRSASQGQQPVVSDQK